MRIFKTYTEAMRSILPNNETLRRIGKSGSEYFKNKIKSGNVSGASLASATIANKVRRGAPQPSYKLYEGGGMADQTKYKVEGNVCKIGYFDEMHKKFKSSDPDINVASLAKIHHETDSRKVLEDDDEFDEIIHNEISKRLGGA